VLLAPRVQDIPAPVQVQVLVPQNWLTATPDPAAPGNFLPGPPRTTDVVLTQTCGAAGVSMSVDPSSSSLTAAASFTLTNARGCANLLLQEYRLGAFAGQPAAGYFVRNFVGGTLPLRPRGSLVITMPAIGVVTLPMAVSTRTWLVGDTSRASMQVSVLLSTPPPTSSLLPTLYALTAPDAVDATKAMVYGLASHAPEVVASLDAGISAGCGATVPTPDPVRCAGFEAQWHDARYVGAEGLLLSGICAGAPNSDALCVPATFSSDAFGVALFAWGSRRAPTSVDLVAGNSALDPTLAGPRFPSGRAPSRIAYQDPAAQLSFRATVLCSGCL